MRREDSGLVALAMLMLVFLALWASVSLNSMSRNETESTRREARQEEHVTSEAVVEENPEITKQEEQTASETVVEVTEDTEQEAAVSDAGQEAKLETKTETQEFSPEEIWKQEMEYLTGYIHGDAIYNNYVTNKGRYELNPNDIPENSYQEYIKATEQLLNEAMENSEISDGTIERYNTAVADVSDKEYLQFDQEKIMSMQGFQEVVTHYSYMEAIKELHYHSKEMTEEQYQAWFEKMLYREGDITHETVMKRIEYSKQLLSQYGKENIPIPYFWGI